MKRIFISFMMMLSVYSISAQGIAPFIKVGVSQEGMQQTYKQVIQALKDHSFTVLGAYNPSGKASLKVIAFTRSDIKNTVVKVPDRGALAAVFKVGLVQKSGKITISYTNPEYILRAYLRGNYSKYQGVFNGFYKDLQNALKEVGSDFSGFGGKLSASELAKYHYKIMMPYFTDPDELGSFDSFEAGLQTITANLKAGKGNTKLVYKVVYKTQKVAVFGVALKSKTDGEAHFLPIIGESHVAALPYEIILQGTKATMLAGKYRIALFWPELTMGTFMKIMSTPGEIEDTLSKVCE